MKLQRDLKVALLIMLILMVAGIIAYTAFSAPSPEEPLRIMFFNKAGKVFFLHSTHSNDYASDCIDCHHNIEDDDIYNCSECHEETSDDEYMPSRVDAFHEQCKGCHEELEAGPIECAECHLL